MVTSRSSIFDYTLLQVSRILTSQEKTSPTFMRFFLQFAHATDALHLFLSCCTLVRGPSGLVRLRGLTIAFELERTILSNWTNWKMMKKLSLAIELQADTWTRVRRSRCCGAPDFSNCGGLRIPRPGSLLNDNSWPFHVVTPKILRSRIRLELNQSEQKTEFFWQPTIPIVERV